MKCLNKLFLLQLLTVILILSIWSGCSNKQTNYRAEDIALINEAFDEFFKFSDSGNYNLAVEYLNQQFGKVRYIPDSLLLKKYEVIYRIRIHHNNIPDLAEKYLDSILYIVEDADNYDYYKLYAYFSKGNIYVRQKRYDEAFEYYYYGKRIIDEKGYVCERKNYETALALLLYKQEDYAGALNYFFAEYQTNLVCSKNGMADDLLLIPHSLVNVALCHELIGNYDSANFYNNLGLEFLDTNASRLNTRLFTAEKIRGVIYGNMGSTFLKQNRIDDAEKYFIQSIQINDVPKREIGDANLNKIKLANLYLLTKKYDKCLQLIKEVEVYLDSTTNLIAQSRLSHLMYLYYMQIGDFKNAVVYRNLDIELRDSLNNSGFKMFSQREYAKEFDILDRKMMLSELQREKEVQRSYLVFLVFGVVGTVIIIYLLLKGRNRNNKYIEKLTNLNLQIEQSNQMLQNSLDTLKKSNEENTRIMRIVAHDLRSPIAGIIGLIRVMKLEGLTDKEKEEAMELIEKSGDNALNFIDDLLHQNQNEEEIALELIDISQTINSCLSLLQVQASNKQQTIHSNTFPLEVMINSEKIWRVINNLLNNAIKFSKIGGQIYLDMKSDNNAVIISIRDEGIGIPQSLQPQVFRMLSGAGRTGSAGEASFGLGLAISKQIVEAHKGEIWFESQENVGTTFFVKLPL
jgi:signal transduction histidine kinase